VPDTGLLYGETATSPSSENRPEGFYWIRLWEGRYAGGWQIAAYRVPTANWGREEWVVDAEVGDIYGLEDVALVGPRLVEPDGGDWRMENPNWVPDYTNRSPLEMRQRGEID
jgi:hypothetical protein